MRSNYRKIGDHIHLVDNRNAGHEVKRLLGLSISKRFIPSVANIIGTDMENYKIIRKNQFACSIMQVRRDGKMPVALLKNFDEAIISQAYPVFEVNDKTELLPEYLMLWFMRSEFDREACFYAVGGVRGSLEWDDFCDMRFPLPSITKQREIVNEYATIRNQVDINRQLIRKLELTAQTIYKRWFIDLEFPNEVGLPYKSGNGKMSQSNLGEIPEGWNIGTLKQLATFSHTRIPLKELSFDTYISTENMVANKGGVVRSGGLPAAKNITRFDVGNILLSNIRPYFKKMWHCEFSGGCSNDVLCLVPKKNIPSLFVYTTLEKDGFFDYVMAGSKGTKMPRGDKKWIMNFPVIVPDPRTLSSFERIANVFSNARNLLHKENKIMSATMDILHSKLATIED